VTDPLETVNTSVDPQCLEYDPKTSSCHYIYDHLPILCSISRLKAPNFYYLTAVEVPSVHLE
jgi:hypothetical protein